MAVERENQHETSSAFFGEADLALRWQVSRRTIQRWRTAGTLPRSVRIGRKVLYDRITIETFEALKMALEAAP